MLKRFPKSPNSMHSLAAFISGAVNLWTAPTPRQPTSHTTRCIPASVLLLSQPYILVHEMHEARVGRQNLLNYAKMLIKLDAF
jgi:hypothetical protein